MTINWNHFLFYFIYLNMSNWNTFRNQYKQKHGTTSIKELSREYTKLTLTNVKKHLLSPRRAKLNKLKGLKKTGRGKVVRGWAASAPQKGTERHLLKQKCGNKAFLLPEREAYPVMDALRNTNAKCVYRCEALNAAKNRARQYHHPAIANKADRLLNQHC